MIGDIELPVARQLPRNEWDRLRSIGPFKSAGVLPNPKFAMVEVLEVGGPGGEIVGTWEVTTLALLEGLYLSEDWRRHPLAARRLLQGMLDLLDKYEIKTALTVTQDKRIARLAAQAGFRELPGTLHLLSRT